MLCWCAEGADSVVLVCRESSTALPSLLLIDRVLSEEGRGLTDTFERESGGDSFYPPSTLYVRPLL